MVRSPYGIVAVGAFLFCNSGRPRPMTLEEELGEKYRAGGVEAALALHPNHANARKMQQQLAGQKD